ncbi:MAG TPA: hypothetical protein VHK90_02110 [Thermoanaerobaculia bacterium]|nr:hypothetical protein [Thermoanaerobaculia bacterium]
MQSNGMSEYDKELDTRTDEYEKAIEPLDRETRDGKTKRDGDEDRDEERRD